MPNVGGRSFRSITGTTKLVRAESVRANCLAKHRARALFSGYKDTSTSKEKYQIVVIAWPTAKIGIATGQPSGLRVVDVTSQSWRSDSSTS